MNSLSLNLKITTYTKINNFIHFFFEYRNKWFILYFFNFHIFHICVYSFKLFPWQEHKDQNL